MQMTSMGQTSVKEISPPELVEGSQPWRRKYNFYSARVEFLLHTFPRVAKRFVSVAKRALMVVVIGTTMVALGRADLLAGPLVQENAQESQAGQDTPEELQQLVAPIALYPDELIAQILAASTYPTEIVQADRWLQQHSNLQGEELAAEVDQESWDPSVKALTAFPSVLTNLDRNLSWTSALGDAYFNQQQDVLDAVQVMRGRAENAGNLQSTPQETVNTQGPTIIIEPVTADLCYLPIYDPWLVYGAPIEVYPGYIYNPWFGPPFIRFGSRIDLGFAGRFGWGWRAWGFNWGRREVVFNHNTYVSRSRTFFYRGPGGQRGNLQSGRSGSSFGGNQQLRGFERNRANGIPNRDSDRQLNQGRPSLNIDRGQGPLSPNIDRGQGRPSPNIDRDQGRPSSNMDHGSNGRPLTPGSEENRREYRGYGEARPNMDTRSGAFSGFGEGGVDRNSASRGRSSIGGGFGGRGSVGGGRSSGGGGVRGGGGGGRHR